MPWRNQGGGGPWGGGSGGGGSGGPWGGGSGGQQPNLEDLMRQGQERFRRMMPGGGRRTFVLAFLAILALWLLSGFYVVETGKRGVVLLFGQWQTTTEPGLNYRLPAPIMTHEVVDVEQTRQINIGFRGTVDAASRGASRSIEQESLMLTSDENIVDMNFTVQWRVDEPSDFLFNLRDVEGTVKIAAESAMREVVGQTAFERAVTEDRGPMENAAKTLLQRIMDDYNAGVVITGIRMAKNDPPAPVIDAFQDVVRARQDRDRLRNQAEAYESQVVPEARGQAEQIRQQAEANRERLVLEAAGEAERFREVLEAYRTAPEVTIRRMYLETIGRVLENTDKIIIDQGEGGVIPYLPLPQLQRQSGGQTGSGGTSP
ncbi:MAG: FtsH protease activity modulator HflK [Alphaproteobacteria bacterium]